MRQADKLSVFRLIPPKFAIALIVVAILYTLLQPLANSKFGWSLPSTASILELDFSSDTPTKSTTSIDKPKEKKPSESTTTSTDQAGSTTKKSVETNTSTAEPKKPESSIVKKSEPPKTPTVEPTKTPSRSEVRPGSNNSDLLYGLLKKTGRDRYVSPAGIEYGPGSEEGHRLKHIERHLTDQPSRAGPHGVFDGSMEEFLKTIDDAFSRAKRGAKGTNKKEDGDSIVYEVNFNRDIGFLGGQDGKRKKNPKLRRLRIVMSDDNEYLITAFPF